MPISRIFIMKFWSTRKIRPPLGFLHITLMSNKQSQSLLALFTDSTPHHRTDIWHSTCFEYTEMILGNSHFLKNKNRKYTWMNAAEAEFNRLSLQHPLLLTIRNRKDHLADTCAFTILSRNYRMHLYTSLLWWRQDEDINNNDNDN